MIRFSLATLFLAVLFAAIGCAALVNANELWRQTMVTATVTALVIATLAAVIWQGQSRVFALGFAVTGWIYLVLVFVSVFGLRNDLLTDKAVVSVYTAIHGEPTLQQQWVQTMAVSTSRARLRTASNNGIIGLLNLSNRRRVGAAGGAQQVEFQDFADISHSLWVIVVACLGGVVARTLSRVKRQERESPSAKEKVGD